MVVDHPLHQENRGKNWNFWSSYNDVFEDEEIDIKEELNPVVIEDLVLDEMDKRRQFGKVIL